MVKYSTPLSAANATDSSRLGPKAANLAALGCAGLPTPGGFGIDASAYRRQMTALNLLDAAREVFSSDGLLGRKRALEIKLSLLEQPIATDVVEDLRQAWREIMSVEGVRCVVRSSALVEDRYGSSFAGQFESFLGIDDEADFLTAVKACWAALWSVRALRYMATHQLDPADTAMALIVQPLVAARVSGGGLSQTPDGEMVLSATWGLGEAIAQGEVVPDRYVLNRDGDLLNIERGRKYHTSDCEHSVQSAAPDYPDQQCLNDGQIAELGQMLLRAEQIVNGPAEIEWALDNAGIKMLQARPLHVAERHAPDEIWLNHPKLRGHAAGVGWGEGLARVVNCECQLSQVAPGDILVTTVAGPSLAQVLPNVSGVVTELGGSTSHLASLARERGVPTVLGVLNATQKIPDRSRMAVDGVTGIVHWMQ